ncbi:MAG: hypothetical protein WC595_03305 [Candidatus Nanoarchaeia archaeon]
MNLKQVVHAAVISVGITLSGVKAARAEENAAEAKIVQQMRDGRVSKVLEKELDLIDLRETRARAIIFRLEGLKDRLEGFEKEFKTKWSNGEYPLNLDKVVLAERIRFLEKDLKYLESEEEGISEVIEKKGYRELLGKVFTFYSAFKLHTQKRTDNKRVIPQNSKRIKREVS